LVKGQPRLPARVIFWITNDGDDHFALLNGEHDKSALKRQS
jgi:hypothetical protein